MSGTTMTQRRERAQCPLTVISPVVEEGVKVFRCTGIRFEEKWIVPKLNEEGTWRIVRELEDLGDEPTLADAYARTAKWRNEQAGGEVNG